MPWCEDCSRFHAPTALGSKGECPSCGAVIGEVPKAPWHFKLLVGAVVAYLGWRAVQGVIWVAEQV